MLDYSKIVWPNPPAVTRMKYLNYFCCDKYVPQASKEEESAGWIAWQAVRPRRRRWPTSRCSRCGRPTASAVDSKGDLYVADGKVGAVFIFNTETKELKMIKNGVQARFGDIIGLAIDDSDRLFVSDTKLHRILVFDKNHKVEGSIRDGVSIPAAWPSTTRIASFMLPTPPWTKCWSTTQTSSTLIRKIGTAGKATHA